MCVYTKVVFLLNDKEQMFENNIDKKERIFYNYNQHKQKKTHPQTVRQHHRTGLIHIRAETLIDIITHLSSDIKRFC